MITLIPSAIDPATVLAVQSILVRPMNSPSAQPRAGLEQRIIDSLLANRAFVRAALPKRIVRLVFDRYEAGMGCSPRVDDPIMEGCRTDLSFTLFLNDPADYDRGDLIVETNAGWETRKHAAGDMVLYPTRYIHSVAPVTRGTRFAAVGWIESLTPSMERREILGDLDAALALLDCAKCGVDARLRVQNARANLVRLWLNGGEA